MPNIGWLIKWRLTAACAVATLGAIAGISYDPENTYTDNGGIGRFLPAQLGKKDSLATAWDRYGTFRNTYQKVLVLCPDPYSVEDFIAFGRDRLLDSQDAATAAAGLRQMLQTTPEEDVAWSDLAWLYAINGNTHNAIAAELKAISLYPYDYTYFVLLGAFYEQSEQNDQAKAAYGQALSLFPRLEHSPFWHALQRRQPTMTAGAFQVAISTLGQMESPGEEPLRSESRARLLFARGDINGAQSIINSVNSQIQNLSGVWELQGEVHEKNMRVDDAKLDYERASFLDQSDPLPHERLAALALKANQIDGANNQVHQAWGLIKRLRSLSSARNTIEFQQGNGPRNGLLPDTLLRETQPAFNFASMFSRLAELYAMQGAPEKARELTDMAERAGPADMFYGAGDKQP